MLTIAIRKATITGLARNNKTIMRFDRRFVEYFFANTEKTINEIIQLTTVKDRVYQPPA
jgi:hypothetical protein